MAIHTEDVIPTMTVNMLDNLIKGDDRDKQLIVGIGNLNVVDYYTDVNGVEANGGTTWYLAPCGVQSISRRNHRHLSNAPPCNGSGKVANSDADQYYESPWMTCPQCGGRGEIV